MLPALLLVSVGSFAALPPARPYVEPSRAQPAARFTPKGFLQMFVAGVMPTPDGHTMVLVNPDEEVLLPVGVGLPEAVSIFGRLENKTAPRPMTHDLLDNVVEALGAEVVRVQIDDLKEGVFIGTVFLKTQGKGSEIVALDARASDAVAVALSAGAPIFVARAVVEKAALTHEDLERMPSHHEPPPLASKVLDL
jgi:bifunctional DNase/RNase